MMRWGCVEAIQQSVVYIVILVLCPRQRDWGSSSRFKVLDVNIFLLCTSKMKKQKLTAAMLLVCTWLIFVLVAAKTLFVYLRNHPGLHQWRENETFNCEAPGVRTLRIEADKVDDRQM